MQVTWVGQRIVGANQWNVVVGSHAQVGIKMVGAGHVLLFKLPYTQPIKYVPDHAKATWLT